ncbi:hypothetical protein [Streptomyces zagrosensis]|uniref:Uncharacterized protein n=1 Tax=Streptomyces zagrosensis TaxID=1042984 RepID=A0A7W9UZD0_9ACTN|nr:hypothetical protein [Streptomyces zagrosensis]MBB5936900.1 hypothetical protein [Streptomyces zagrosensis]
MSLPAAITVEYDSAPEADELLSHELADLVGLDMTEEWPAADSATRRPPEAESPSEIARADTAKADAFAFRGVVVARAGSELAGWARLLQPPGEAAAVVFDHILVPRVRRRLSAGRYAVDGDPAELADERELLTLLLQHAATHAKRLGFATINWNGPDTDPIGLAAEELGARVDAELGRHWTVPDLKAWAPPPGLPQVTLRATARPFPAGPDMAVEAYVRLYNHVHAQDTGYGDHTDHELIGAVPDLGEDGAALEPCPGNHAEAEPPWDAAGIDAYLTDLAPQGHVLDLLTADGALTAQLAAGLADDRALLEVTVPRDASPAQLAAGIAGLIAHLRAADADATDLDIREIADPPLRQAAELLGARITSRWQAYALTL